MPIDGVCGAEDCGRVIGSGQSDWSVWSIDAYTDEVNIDEAGVLIDVDLSDGISFIIMYSVPSGATN